MPIIPSSTWVTGTEDIYSEGGAGAEVSYYVNRMSAVITSRRDKHELIVHN